MAGRTRNPATEVTERNVKAAERRAQALNLKIAGATYDAIARTLGYANRGNAHRDIHTALAAITKEPAEEYVKLQMARLDEMLLALWPKVRKGDAHAISRALTVMHQQNQLAGVYAPTRQTVTVITEDVIDAEIRRLEDELAAREAANAEPD